MLDNDTAQSLIRALEGNTDASKLLAAALKEHAQEMTALTDLLASFPANLEPVILALVGTLDQTRFSLDGHTNALNMSARST